MCTTTTVHQVERDTPDSELLTLCYSQSSSGTPAIVLTLKLNGKDIPMELDTGAAVSVMAEAECLKHFPDASVRDTYVKLVTYNGTPVPIKGVMDFEVRY